MGHRRRRAADHACAGTRKGLFAGRGAQDADNRSIVEDFADLFYERRRVRQAFERHVSRNYIQHNPGLIDGPDAALEMLEPMFGGPVLASK